jgi:hypothetical protein
VDELLDAEAITSTSRRLGASDGSERGSSTWM